MRDRGKQFEERFKQDWKKTFPNSVILRLPDQMSGYKKTSKNVSDFIGYVDGKFYFIECKTHKGASIPFENISQYDLMKQYVGIEGVRAGVILWLYEKDFVCYIPVSTITQLKKDGKKSVGIKAYNDGYNIKLIPSKKKRIFMESDYSLLLELKEGE